LRVRASSLDQGALSYQWYSSPDGLTFTAIDGAAAASFIPASAQAATVYYRCEVTNTVRSLAGDVYTATAVSDIAVIVFKPTADFSGNWDGEGTAAEPFLIQDQADLMLLRYMVNTQGVAFAGFYFEMTGDIALPADWTPIGGYKSGQTSGGSGKNIWNFSGVFDGGGHLLTVPAQGLPLFNHVRGATVRNLAIYGEKIAGYGLINRYEVDYGPSGANNGSALDNFTVNIEQVTIKSGTQTLQSGFIGGFASGLNGVNITDCTVEAGVVIGYDRLQSDIGSFAGSFNGAIQGSVSYATVYGVDSVGGLVGSKGQAIGACTVKNSAFHGNVLAVGASVGGIIGSGYSSISDPAPNSPCVSVQNCYVTGSVSGGSQVGGILGAEPGVAQCWDSGVGYIQNNHFTGSLTATDGGGYAGGIIGFMKSLNVYNVVTNNYYLTTSAVRGLGYVEMVDTSCGTVNAEVAAIYFNTALGGRGDLQAPKAGHNRADDPLGADADKLAKAASLAEFQDGTVTGALNAGANGSGWIQGENYPIFGGAVTLTGLEVSGFKTVYHLGDSFSTGGMTVTAVYSDGTAAGLAVSEVAFSGFDSGTAGSKTVTAAYRNQTCTFQVTVMESAGGSGSGITVWFSLWGDSAHEEGGTSHTWKNGNLIPWLANKSYTLTPGSTVLTLLATALTQAGLTWENPSGNYVQSITYNGVTLGEMTNGNKSGWLYRLNGAYTLYGIGEQRLSNGDVVVFHYSDDYSAEQSSSSWGGGGGSNGVVPEEKKAVDQVTQKMAETAAPLAAAAVWVNPYADVAEDDWFYAAVRYAVEKGLMVGVGAGDFAPNADLTRAMFVTILYRYEGKPAVAAGSAFSDVPPDQWYTEAVAWAGAQQIISGYGDGSFGAEDSITRAQTAAILYRYAESKHLDLSPTAALSGYTDADDIPDWAREAVGWAHGAGILNGRTAATLAPAEATTRAEAAVLLLEFNPICAAN
jgi:hypothetical protein